MGHAVLGGLLDGAWTVLEPASQAAALGSTISGSSSPPRKARSCGRLPWCCGLDGQQARFGDRSAAAAARLPRWLSAGRDSDRTTQADDQGLLSDVMGFLENKLVGGRGSGVVPNPSARPRSGGKLLWIRYIRVSEANIVSGQLPASRARPMSSGPTGRAGTKIIRRVLHRFTHGNGGKLAGGRRRCSKGTPGRG
jgi:hypothetical protein